MGKGEPTSETMVQDYTSNWYRRRYSGNGFLYHARIVTEMLDGVRMSDRRSDKVLDAGCGIGFVSQLYPNFDIIGVDISDGMLRQNPFNYVKAPVENLPFESNTFDVVIARSLLHHLEDPMAGINEMYRVLKPGGKFVCWDPNHGFLYELVRHLFQRTERFSHLHKSFNDKELIDMLENVFTVTEVRYIGYIAYPILGFPDIVNFRVPIGLGKFVIAIDDLISKSWFKRFSWSIMMKGVKDVQPPR